jgi:hypothetical protein
MTTPEIQALGVTQDSFTMRWKTRGYVEGIGWLEPWAESLVTAMEALQALAARRVAEASPPHRRMLRDGAPRETRFIQNYPTCLPPSEDFSRHPMGRVAIGPSHRKNEFPATTLQEPQEGNLWSRLGADGAGVCPDVPRVTSQNINAEAERIRGQ